MKETFTHKCIKPGCDKTYSSDEEDAYYCSTCLEQRKVLVKEIDAKIAMRPKVQIKTGLQEYDEARRGMPFPSINSLGIKL